jgi:hypothetical protein
LQELGDRTRIKLEWIQETIAPLLEGGPVELYERSDPADPTRIRLRPLKICRRVCAKAITIKIDPRPAGPLFSFWRQGNE